MSLRGRNAPVAIRIPRPPSHGKAVTGGFFFPPHRQGTRALPYKALRYRAGRTGSSAPTNRSVGAGVPDGPLYRTPCNASVGADGHIGPPHRTPCNLSVGAGFYPARLYCTSCYTP